MSTSMGDFTDILIRQGTISPEQLNEATVLSNREPSLNIADALIRLGYATGDEVMRAVAQQHGLSFINLDEVIIPPSVVELVPESVARENSVLPLTEKDGDLTVIVSDPLDLETIDKLRFILNCKIDIALASRENIHESINKYYGQVGEESADSMLQEFTDTAIDFTETEDDGQRDDDIIDENSAPVVRLVHYMISEAVQNLADQGITANHLPIKWIVPFHGDAIAEIINVIEGPIAMTECVGAPGECKQEAVCRIRNNWEKINQTIFGALEDISLLDMASSVPDSLVRLDPSQGKEEGLSVC